MIENENGTIFEYLDELRESGTTFPMEAASCIMDRFDVSEEVARKLLAEWGETFAERQEAPGAVLRGKGSSNT